jgi:phosphoribosylformylglycinamidine synthase subunit PurS
MNAPTPIKARITVTLKDGVLDPQGKAIEGALLSFGLMGLGAVRQGKVFDLDVAAADRSSAELVLIEACEKLLANLVVEDYKIEILG